MFHCPLSDDLWNINNNELVGDIIKKKRDDDLIEDGITFELECNFIDLRPAKLEMKLKYLKDKQYALKDPAQVAPTFQFDMLKFAEFVNKVA